MGNVLCLIVCCIKILTVNLVTGILLRLKEKLGQEAALEFQLKKSGEHQQELLLDALLDRNADQI